MRRMSARGAALLALGITVWLGVPSVSQAGFTETLPKGLFLLEEGVIVSSTDRFYTRDGKLGPIVEDVQRYEPGGSLQGTIKVNARSEYVILLNQLQYGLRDDLTLAVAVPVVLDNAVDPRLGWEPGDYQPGLGRSYLEDDFWKWAASMGQPKPGRWSGNQGTPADSYLGLRYRFTDRWPAWKSRGWAASVMVLGALPTGRPPDPEEPVATGTTAWDLHAMGEYGVHASADKELGGVLARRLALGVDLYYEILLPHEYRTPTGSRHPLLLTYTPYVGSTYRLDPGDHSGVSTQLDLVAWRGPARATWLSRRDPAVAEGFPPVLTASARYTFNHLQQSDWSSDSALWDWDREKVWRPGYRNILTGTVLASLLRVGLPLQVYLSYRNTTWIPGKSAPAVNSYTAGLRLPVRF